MPPTELTATLLMPIKNELIGLQAILPKIDLRLFVQVLIVDGESTDGSYEYAKNQGFDVVQLKSPHLSQEMLDAYPYIKGDYIVTF
ncbi:MAG: glycosyltransferase, partial [Deltaproteobacteria bacterium]